MTIVLGNRIREIEMGLRRYSMKSYRSKVMATLLRDEGMLFVRSQLNIQVIDSGEYSNMMGANRSQ